MIHLSDTVTVTGILHYHHHITQKCVIYNTKFSEITYLPRITKLHPETQLPRHHALRYFPQCTIQYSQPCRSELAIQSYTTTFFVVNTYRIIRFKKRFRA